MATALAGEAAPSERPSPSQQSISPAPFAFPTGVGHRRERNLFVVALPRSVSIALPRAWRILGPNELQLIETSAEALADLSGLDVDTGPDQVLVAANSMPPSTYAAVRVTSSTPASATPAEIEELAQLVGHSSHTHGELAALERELLPQTEVMLRKGGIPLLQFYGVRVERISGHPALVTEYRRAGPKGDVFVQLNHIFTPQQDVQVNLSYRQAEQRLWMPVLGRIRQSLQLR